MAEIQHVINCSIPDLRDGIYPKFHALRVVERIHHYVREGKITWEYLRINSAQLYLWVKRIEGNIDFDDLKSVCREFGIKPSSHDYAQDMAKILNLDIRIPKKPPPGQYFLPYNYEADLMQDLRRKLASDMRWISSFYYISIGIIEELFLG